MSCKVNNFIFTSQNTEVRKVKWPPWSHICRKDTPRDGATKPVTTAERDAISFSPLPHPTLLGSMWRRSHEGIGTRADTGVASVFMVHSLAEWTPAGAQPHRKVEPSAGLCRTHLPHHSPITHTCYINFNRKIVWTVGRNMNRGPNWQIQCPVPPDDRRWDLRTVSRPLTASVSPSAKWVKPSGLPHRAGRIKWGIGPLADSVRLVTMAVVLLRLFYWRGRLNLRCLSLYGRGLQDGAAARIGKTDVLSICPYSCCTGSTLEIIIIQIVANDWELGIFQTRLRVPSLQSRGNTIIALRGCHYSAHLKRRQLRSLAGSVG